MFQAAAVLRWFCAGGLARPCPPENTHFECSLQPVHLDVSSFACWGALITDNDFLQGLKQKENGMHEDSLPVPIPLGLHPYFMFFSPAGYTQATFLACFTLCYRMPLALVQSRGRACSEGMKNIRSSWDRDHKWQHTQSRLHCQCPAKAGCCFLPCILIVLPNMAGGWGLVPPIAACLSVFTLRRCESGCNVDFRSVAVFSK